MPGLSFVGQKCFLVKDYWAYPFSSVSSRKLGRRLIPNFSDEARTRTVLHAVFHGLQPPANSCPSVTWAKFFQVILHREELDFIDTQLCLSYPRLINDFWWSTRSSCIKCSFSRSTTSTSSSAYVYLAKKFSLSRIVDGIWFFEWHRLRWHPCADQMSLVKYSVEACRM